MADDFEDLLKKIIKDGSASYKESVGFEYAFDPLKMFNKGECVNCEQYICSEETRCYKDADGVTQYGCVLCPGCLKGRSVVSTEKTRYCPDFKRLLMRG